jgi:hypothetical protein
MIASEDSLTGNTENIVSKKSLQPMHFLVCWDPDPSAVQVIPVNLNVLPSNHIIHRVSLKQVMYMVVSIGHFLLSICYTH